MASFTFRAQAALDLRRREDEEAQRARATAAIALTEAQAAVERAGARLADARSQAARADGEACDLARPMWYRNWISGLQLELARCRDIAARRQREADAATERALVARRRLRALEKLRERALRRFVERERRHEQRAIDEMGPLQYANRKIGGRT